MILGTLGVLGVFLGFALAMSHCGGPEGDPDLRGGIRVVRYLSSPQSLRLSSFVPMNPQGKPSQFVSWMFSTFGTAEWPPSEEMAEQDPMEAEQAKSIGMPLIPKGVALVPRTRQAGAGKQVVVRADDVRGVLIAEAYDAADGPPVLVQEWRLRLPRKR